MSRGLRYFLGLDPGLCNTGWGVVASDGVLLRYVAHGVIRPPVKETLCVRLSYLFEHLAQVCETYQPQLAAVEEVFVNKNPASTLKLGCARGVVILAPARYGIPVAEYAANRVKQATVGHGHADKAQVQAMVRHLLPGCGVLQADSADALAIAICHTHYSATAQRIAESRS